MPHTIKDKGCMHNMQPLVGIKYANKCTASEKKEGELYTLKQIQCTGQHVERFDIMLILY